MPARLAHVHLEAQDHAVLYDAVVAVGVPVLDVVDHRVLGAQAQAVGDVCVTGGQEAVGQLVAALGELSECQAGLKNGAVVGQDLTGEPVQRLLLRGRLVAGCDPAAGDVDAVAVGADQIGVEADEVAGLDCPVGAFREPRVGPRPARQQPGLEPLAAAGDVACVQARPQLVLGDSGPQRLPHLVHRLLGAADGPAHRHDLLGMLAVAGQLGEAHGRDGLEAAALQGREPGALALVERDPQTASAVEADQVGDLVGPQVGRL